MTFKRLSRVTTLGVLVAFSWSADSSVARASSQQTSGYSDLSTDIAPNDAVAASQAAARVSGPPSIAASLRDALEGAASGMSHLSNSVATVEGPPTVPPGSAINSATRYARGESARLASAEPQDAKARATLPGLPSARVVEWDPDPKVVVDEGTRRAMSATKLPWRIHLEIKGEPLEMLLVPPGMFVMGQSLGDITAAKREGKELPGKLKYYETPAHEVKITKPFYLSRYEITEGIWHAASPLERMLGNRVKIDKALTVDSEKAEAAAREYWTRVGQMQKSGMTKAEAQAKAGAAPPQVDPVWVLQRPRAAVEPEPFAIRSFLREVNDSFAGESAWLIQLPTEAQWEYACRAGSRSARYDTADKVNPDRVKGQEREVGLSTPNAWGFYDMLGNVAEWTCDGYKDRPYPSDLVVDPHLPEGIPAWNSWELPPGVEPVRVYWRVYRGSKIYDTGGQVDGSSAPIASYRGVGKWGSVDSHTDFSGFSHGFRPCLVPAAPVGPR